MSTRARLTFPSVAAIAASNLNGDIYIYIESSLFKFIYHNTVEQRNLIQIKMIIYRGVSSLHGPHHVAEKSTIVGELPSAMILVLN